MPALHLLIKPASSLCNLRCRYCFYHDVAENREIGCYGSMKPEMLEVLVRQAFAYASCDCTFAFQGGEPTLAGLDFYHRLISLQKQYNTNGLRVHNVLQTNGMVIDEAWASFLAENSFLVGLSLDGPREVHDALRVDVRGNGSFDRVMETARLLNNHKVDVNVLCVVSRFVARHPGKVYQFYKKHGFEYLQFIPCMEPLGVTWEGEPSSLTSDSYGHFLKQVFDRYYHDFIAGERVSIRTFDNWAKMLAGYPPDSCAMAGSCVCCPVVEADGSVYPCDFYATDDWRLGNITSQGFNDLLHSAKARSFVLSSRHMDMKCQACSYMQLCRGGCRRDRQLFLDGKPVLNRFCGAYQDFFQDALPRLERMAALVRRGR